MFQIESIICSLNSLATDPETVSGRPASLRGRIPWPSRYQLHNFLRENRARDRLEIRRQRLRVLLFRFRPSSAEIGRVVFELRKWREVTRTGSDQLFLSKMAANSKTSKPCARVNIFDLVLCVSSSIQHTHSKQKTTHMALVCMYYQFYFMTGVLRKIEIHVHFEKS